MTERLHFSLSCIGEGNGNPLQCSCLENPRDGGAWWAAIYGVAQSRTRLKWLSSVCVFGRGGSVFLEINYPSAKCILLLLLLFSHSNESDSLRPHVLYPARLLCPWDSPGKNTGVGCHLLFQGIFPTQGLNLSLLWLLHCRKILYPPGKSSTKYKKCKFKLSNSRSVYSRAARWEVLEDITND